MNFKSIKIYLVLLFNLIALDLTGLWYIFFQGYPHPSLFNIWPADIAILGSMAVIVSSLMGLLTAIIIKKRENQQKKSYKLPNFILIFLVLLLLLELSVFVSWQIKIDLYYSSVFN